MPRKKSSPSHKYFKFNLNTNKSICQIDNCFVELSGNHAKNLERHIESMHFNVYKNINSLKIKSHTDQSLDTRIIKRTIEEDDQTKVKMLIEYLPILTEYY